MQKSSAIEPYSFARSGDGYVFRVAKANGGGLAIGLFLPALLLALFTFGISLLVWLIWAVARGVRMKGQVQYGPPYAEVFVSPHEIRTAKGETIAVNRLHAIDIKNAFDRGYQVSMGSRSSGGFVVGGAAGAGMALSSGISGISSSFGQAAANQAAKARFYLNAEVGGRAVKIVEFLTEVGARSLQSDIIRVIQGDQL